MRKTPYLDKLSTSAHLPASEGQHGYCSTSADSFPDLEHTGVRSKFQPKITLTVNPHGTLTGIYKLKAYERVRSIHREDCAEQGKELAIKTGHKQFIDKILLDMEEAKNKRFHKEMSCYRTQKTNMGYSTNEFSFEPANNNKDDIAARIDDVENSDEYNEPFEYDDSSPVPALTTAVVVKTKTKKETRAPRAAQKPVKRVFNRMSLFESLMDQTKPPGSPKKRFGTITTATELKETS